MRAAAMRKMAAMGLVLSALAPGLAAQDTPASAELEQPGLEREMRALNTTLAQLVGLLRRQLESSNAAVLMQRVQLMTSRIAPLEEELQTARGERRNMENELDELELSASSFESQLERQVEQGDLSADEARGVIEQQLPILEQRKKQLEGHLWTTQQRVIDLEQRLTARRGEIETWESEIDRVLGLR